MVVRVTGLSLDPGCHPLLSYLLEHVGAVVSRDEERAVEAQVHVAHLGGWKGRKNRQVKLEGPFILMVGKQSKRLPLASMPLFASEPVMDAASESCSAAASASSSGDASAARKVSAASCSLATRTT